VVTGFGIMAGFGAMAGFGMMLRFGIMPNPLAELFMTTDRDRMCPQSANQCRMSRGDCVKPCAEMLQQGVRASRRNSLHPDVGLLNGC